MTSSFVDCVRSRRPCCGTWLTLGSPYIAELCIEFGFQWVLVDLEHGCVDERCVMPILQASRGSTTAVVVRVPSSDPAVIGRMLDWGADGIMAPHVSDPEQAQACVAAMRFAPRGIRGFSRSTRCFGYGLRVPSNLSEHVQPVFLAQIEDLSGLQHASEIARVDGVDGLFVGTTDLGAALAGAGATESRSLEDAVQTIVGAACDAEKAVGLIVRDAGGLQQAMAQGFSLFAMGSDVGVLRNGYSRVRAEFGEVNRPTD